MATETTHLGDKKPFSRWNRIPISPGDKFNRLVVVGADLLSTSGQSFYLCRCSCGKYIRPSASNIYHNRTRSCGCYTSDRMTARAHSLVPVKCDICGFGSLGEVAASLHRDACLSRRDTPPVMKNSFEVRGEVTAIFLDRMDGSTMETIIDTADLALASAINGRWHAAYDKRHKTYYASHVTPRPYRTTLSLHRVITGAAKGAEVDHLDHDGLNNKRSSNLKVGSTSANQLNRLGPTSRSKSGILGVSWNIDVRKWRAQIRVNGVAHYLGAFDSKEDAGLALAKFRADRGLPL